MPPTPRSHYAAFRRTIILNPTTVQLTLRQAAGYLGVDEGTLRRWINQRGLPAHSVNERLYLNPIELWEWAIEAGVPVSRALLEQANRAPDEVPPLADLLREGGIFDDVGGETKSQVLAHFVERLPLPPEQDRKFLLDVLEAREALGSTGIGDGIAIPHARNPIVLHLPRPMVSLCYLAQPVDFGAIDGKPVHTLFTIVSPAIKTHLALLSRLAFALRDKGFAAVVAQKGTLADALPHARRIDGLVAGGASKAVPRP